MWGTFLTCLCFLGHVASVPHLASERSIQGPPPYLPLRRRTPLGIHRGIMMNKRHTSPRQHCWLLGPAFMLAGLAQPAAASESTDLGKVTPDVLTKEQRAEADGMIERDIRRRTVEANARNRE